MRWLLGLAFALALAAAFAAPALAADGVTIKVSLKDDKGKPVQGAGVHVVWAGQPAAGPDASPTKTGADGSVALQKDANGKPLPDGPYKVTVMDADRQTTTIVYAGKGAAAEAFLGSGDLVEPSKLLFSDIAKQASEAKQKCDKEGYDQAVATMKKMIAAAERQSQEYRDAAEALREGRQLPVKDVKGAEKILDKAAKVGGTGAPVDPGLVKSLRDYAWLYHESRSMDALVESMRKQLAAIPAFAAACPRQGDQLYVQGGCPAGQVPAQTSALGGLIADLGLKGSGPGCVDRHNLDHDRDRDHDRGHKD